MRNYYHLTNLCDCCGRYDQEHIGKAGSRRFTLHVTDDIPDLETWLERLKSGEIINEDYDILDFDEFTGILLGYQLIDYIEGPFG